MIFQKIVLLYLLVIECVKVGVQCIIGEGITPTNKICQENWLYRFKGPHHPTSLWTSKGENLSWSGWGPGVIS